MACRAGVAAALERGTGGKLTLVSAPAGFGKSTLLAEWLAADPAGERVAAWVSLDQTDSDPVSFWSYVFAALRARRPEIGEQALSLHRSPHPPPNE